MKRLAYIFVLVAAFVSLNALALAQGNNASDPVQSRLWTELELTDQAIERAREAIQKASSPAAAAALEQAVELQKQARERYQARQPLAALQLTRRAREKAKLALANGRIAEQNEGTVLRELERVEQLLDRASEQVGESARVGNVQSMIDMARNNLDKAWELYRAEQYRPALKLTNQAETALRKVVSLLERQSTQTANFERRLVTVEETYRRVQEGLSDCESEQARRLMEQARTMLSQAHELALNGQYDAALRALKNAQDKAQSALRECRNPDVLQTRHDQIAEQVKRFSERVPAGDNATRRLLDQAWEQLRQAQQQIRAGNLESAAASLRAAQLLLTQAQERFDWDNL